RRRRGGRPLPAGDVRGRVRPRRGGLMPEFSVDDVKRLRDITGAGMMDCRNALTESGGDVDKAVTLLREKGIAKAAKRAGRATVQGVVESYLRRTGDYPPQ